MARNMINGKHEAKKLMSEQILKLNNRMKTNIKKILALTLAVLFGMTQVMAGIDDPMNSDNVKTSTDKSVELNVPAMMVEFSMEDELYIDDIPFETEGIVIELNKNDVNMPLCYTSFVLADEAYIDDIPFDTEEIANAVRVNNSEMLFAMDDESYIDDIPFNTEAIYECFHNNSERHCALVAK